MEEFFILMKSELIVLVIMFILLIIKISSDEMKNESLLRLVNILLLLNFIAGCFFNRTGSLFGGMFTTGTLIAFEKSLLNLGTLLISLQTYDWLKKHEHVSEFYLLLLSTLVGMFFMISSNNLLMFYLGLELSAIPLTALSNFDLEKRRSSEAAMKFIMSSAFSSGMLLFGISLLYGTTGTLNFAAISGALTGSPLQLLSFILLLAGFGFKISAVPFHLWTADVYEGSPVSVTAYLSVISKGAMFFVMASVLYIVFKPLAATWYNMLFLLAVLTMITGNLFAIRQNNLKRFLAFSSVAQVGFILIGLSGSSQEATASVIYFIMIYIFSNLGAFGVVTLIASKTGKESVEDYRGLYHSNPWPALVLTLSLFSLAGIPPTAGFFGKFFLLMAGAGKGNYLLITIAALNMVVSLYYYLRIVKAMFMDTNETPLQKLEISMLPQISLLLCVAGLLTIGFSTTLYDYIYALSPTF
ncbi:MAG: NADH-quinone oxidoreductase subunit N [Chitinophagales bacterium]|nr:NADH-quinone oxidoreductase subunit N [Chitinophagales bacterium]